MKTILSIITILMNIMLLTVATTNIITAPLFMASMMLISSTLIFFIVLDLAESLKEGVA